MLAPDFFLSWWDFNRHNILLIAILELNFFSGFYNPNAPPAEYTPQNPFYRFKAIVYSVKPTVEPRDGFVALQFNKKEEEIR